MAPPAGRSLAAMEDLCEELILTLAGKGSAASDRCARLLTEHTHQLPGELVGERACRRSLARVALAGMADRLARAAATQAGWTCAPRRRRTASEALVGALIARMRLVARNLD